MKNPLIDDLDEAGMIPSIEVALPTLAAFYPKGEVLRPEADPLAMKVYPLSVLDESSFRDPLMLLSGQAIGKMVRRVCPGVDDPGKLTDLDVQVIILACRIASYGSTLKLEHTCSKCQTKTDLQVDLNDHILRYSPFSPDELAEFDLDIVEIGQKIRLRPMLYEDAIDVAMNMVRSNISAEKFDSAHTEDVNQLTDAFILEYQAQFESSIRTNIDAICSSIFTVTTTTGKVVNNPDMIKEWFLRLTPNLTKMITDRITKINLSIRERSKLAYTCVSCGTENTFYMA